MLICFLLSGGISLPAHATLNCWMANHVDIHFGSIAAGTAVTMPIDTADIECTNSEGDNTSRWVRVCLSLSIDQPVMVNYNPGGSLTYHIYQSGDPTPVGKNHYATIDWQLPPQNSNQHIPLQLIAKIDGNQKVGYGYYQDDSKTGTFLHYGYSENQRGLHKCNDMPDQAPPSTIAANATVINGCDQLEVTNLLFGSHNPTEGSQLTATGNATVTLRCPINTKYNVAMSMGQHYSGTTRQICNEKNECIAYGLFKDTAHNQPWDDSANKLEDTATTGDTQSIPVFGYVPPQNWPSAGDYQDDVVVTLSY